MGELDQVIDTKRCLEAMKQITVYGAPTTTKRISLVEEAIELINKDPENALKEEYLGIKIYSGFGEQREDHKYGYSPRHGSIVFSVDRNRNIDKLDKEKCLYLLLAFLDFKYITVKKREWPNTDHHFDKNYGLCSWLKHLNEVEEKRRIIYKKMDNNLKNNSRLTEFIELIEPQKK